MEFDLDQRTARLSVGELANFAVGPRDGGDGPTGIWRAQLGSHWHREMEAQTRTETSDASFEVGVTGEIFAGGWTLHLTGRIDQILPHGTTTVLREIKTLTRTVPVSEADLRADYPHYFAQLATYLMLRRIQNPAGELRGELVWVETATGLSQTIVLSREDEKLCDRRIQRVTQFLDQHLRARDRRRNLVIQPAFATPRPGQEDTLDRLIESLATHPITAFEAPTGFGKTGVMLEAGLHALKTGRCDRLVYLTSKSTGQLQVLHTLAQMTALTPAAAPPECHTLYDTPERPDAGGREVPLAVWQVRNKREHCVNHTFHCTRETCRFLQDVESRWPHSGLDRFHLFPQTPPTVETLRQAGTDASICPYEITRTALAFQDVWVGDYNYVFAPRNRGVFTEQPGWNPARTLLIVDEAHNLASRVADAYSAKLTAAELRAVLATLDGLGVSKALLRRWETLTLSVAGIRRTDAVDLPTEEDLAAALAAVVEALTEIPIDYARIEPDVADVLWRPAELVAWLEEPAMTRLLWASRDGELEFTCLDAAPFIGTQLREFGRVILASATIGSTTAAAQAWGLTDSPPQAMSALTPWRNGAYNVAVDLRVDTRYQQRAHHYDTTAQTIAALAGAATECAVVFFPSYRYAETIRDRLEQLEPGIRAELQPRRSDLATQSAWVEQSLALSDVLFLVLGSSFAEGVDMLGGRVSHAMVVGPALPEVNPRQKAWQEELRRKSGDRESAFDRVFRQPGLQKVNQGLGRLVRAPGHRTRVLLHCQRFMDPAYARWLAPEYQHGTHLPDDQSFHNWLNNRV